MDAHTPSFEYQKDYTPVSRRLSLSTSNDLNRSWLRQNWTWRKFLLEYLPFKKRPRKKKDRTKFSLVMLAVVPLGTMPRAWDTHTAGNSCWGFCGAEEPRTLNPTWVKAQKRPHITERYATWGTFLSLFVPPCLIRTMGLKRTDHYSEWGHRMSDRPQRI